jgi:hypothetical protein
MLKDRRLGGESGPFATTSLAQSLTSFATQPFQRRTIPPISLLAGRSPPQHGIDP